MLKKTISATILTGVLFVSATAGQTGDSAATKKQEQKTASAKAKDGTDCQPQRAGVKCSRRKARKPWFFGK